METDDFMKRGIIMVNQKNTIKENLIKRIAPSILLLLIIIASLTGATYAWFIAGSNNETVFTAGTVKLNDPDIDFIDISVGSVTKYAFIPNSGEASVSKVDLETDEEIARYYTAPRLGDEIIHADNSTSTNDIAPQDWRTSRIAQDDDGNVWVLNVGADGDDLQGSVVRIQANTEGLSNTATSSSPLPFGDDDAVQVFPVGDPGDMPRALAIDDDGYIWIGFYSGAQLMKYEYDSYNETLTVKRGPYKPDEKNVIRYYEMKFAPDGNLFISSRNSNPTKSPRETGIWKFKPSDNTFVRETDFDAYSILIGGTASEYRVYATEYNRIINYRDSSGNWNTSGNITPSGSQNRGMAFDNNGVVWVASTTGSGDNFSGQVIGWWDPYGEQGSDRGYITLQTGSVPVGLGLDPTGTMWAVCRTDINSVGGYIEAFDPENKSGTNNLDRSIQVGYRPYAYGDFSIVDNTCKTVRWEFENEGTKKVFVRAKPTATLDGKPVAIALCDDESNWRRGDDGWYYLGNEQEPTIVESSDNANNRAYICFEYCFEAGSEEDLIIKLEGQAVQYSNNAIDYEWSPHPWSSD